MSTPADQDETLQDTEIHSVWIEDTEVPKPHIPIQKVSRFGNQGASKFGKWALSANPPMKQRPGRAAGRGR